jgi:hypothetical protein
MATTSITASPQVAARSGNQTTWALARDATAYDTATAYTSSIDNTQAITEFVEIGSKGSTYAVNRTFLFFDLSGINGTITAMSLKVYGVTNASINVRPAKSTAFGGDGSASFQPTDFNNWSPSSPTTYTSTAGQAWSINQYNTFTLNSTARSDANTDGYLNVVLLGSSFDYPNNTPLVNTDRKAGVRFGNTTTPITLEITYTPSGYGNDVNGVASANITSINGVATANIASINDVS